MKRGYVSRLASSLWMVVTPVSVSSIATFSEANQRSENVERNSLCGADCLFVTLCYLGSPPNSYTEFLGKMGDPPEEGHSLLELRDTARHYGAFAEYMKLDVDTLERLSGNPQIILLLKNPSHFVIVNSVQTASDEVRVELQDPRTGFRVLSENELTSRWDGNTLLVSLNPISLGTAKYIQWLYISIGFLSLAAVAVFLKRRFA